MMSLVQLNPRPDNPFDFERVLFVGGAIGGNGYPLGGPEELVYNYLCSRYTKEEKLVAGTIDQLVESILEYVQLANTPELRFGERRIRRAIDDLVQGYDGRPPLLELRDSKVWPTRAFGLKPGVLAESKSV